MRILLTARPMSAAAQVRPPILRNVATGRAAAPSPLLIDEPETEFLQLVVVRERQLDPGLATTGRYAPVSRYRLLNWISPMSFCTLDAAPQAAVFAL